MFFDPLISQTYRPDIGLVIDTYSRARPVVVGVIPSREIVWVFLSVSASYKLSLISNRSSEISAISVALHLQREKWHFSLAF